MWVVKCLHHLRMSKWMIVKWKQMNRWWEEWRVRKEGGKRERESFLNARWKSSWHLSHYCGDGFSCIAPTHMHVQSHKQAHTCRATSCHSTPPAQHLVIKARPRRALIFRGERMNYSTRQRSWRAPMSHDFTLLLSQLYVYAGSFSVLITIFMKQLFCHFLPYCIFVFLRAVSLFMCGQTWIRVAPSPSRQVGPAIN